MVWLRELHLWLVEPQPPMAAGSVLMLSLEVVVFDCQYLCSHGAKVSLVGSP
jgi:hypothetical protein